MRGDVHRHPVGQGPLARRRSAPGRRATRPAPGRSAPGRSRTSAARRAAAAAWPPGSRWPGPARCPPHRKATPGQRERDAAEGAARSPPRPRPAAGLLTPGSPCRRQHHARLQHDGAPAPPRSRAVRSSPPAAPARSPSRPGRASAARRPGSPARPPGPGRPPGRPPRSGPAPARSPGPPAARGAGADPQHRPPRGERGAQAGVPPGAGRQPVQALGDRLARVPGQRRGPVSAATPGSMPAARIAAGNGRPSASRCRNAAASRITPLMPARSPGVVISISRKARGCCRRPAPRPRPAGRRRRPCPRCGENALGRRDQGGGGGHQCFHPATLGSGQPGSIPRRVDRHG